MENKLSLGLKEALNLTLERIKPLPMENVELIGSVDRTAATDLYALVDSPSIDASMKDGYAYCHPMLSTQPRKNLSV